MNNNNQRFNGYNRRFNGYNQRFNIMYAFIGMVVLIGGGIYMNVIKIPGFNFKNTFNSTTPRLREQTTPDVMPSKKSTVDKTDEIPCPYDCSSIPGSSCINGKCTDPYLQL